MIEHSDDIEDFEEAEGREAVTKILAPGRSRHSGSARRASTSDGLVMAEFSEGNLRDSVSLWDGYPRDYPSFARRLRRIDRKLSGEDGARPLTSLARFSKSLERGYLSRFGYHVLGSQVIESETLDASQRIRFFGRRASYCLPADARQPRAPDGPCGSSADAHELSGAA